MLKIESTARGLADEVFVPLFESRIVDLSCRLLSRAMRNAKERECAMLEEGTTNVKAIDPALGARLNKITSVTSARASVHPALES